MRIKGQEKKYFLFFNQHKRTFNSKIKREQKRNNVKTFLFSKVKSMDNSGKGLQQINIGGMGLTTTFGYINNVMSLYVWGSLYVWWWDQIVHWFHCIVSYVTKYFTICYNHSVIRISAERSFKRIFKVSLFKVYLYQKKKRKKFNY